MKRPLAASRSTWKRIAQVSRFAIPVTLICAALFPQQERGKRRERDGGVDEVDDKIHALPPAPAPTPLAAKSRVGDAQRERQAPFLVALGEGRYFAGCVEWEGGAGDRIALREIDAAGKVARTLFVAAAPAEIDAPCGALDREGRLTVVWTQLAGERAQLFAARLEGEAFTAPVALTTGPLPNLHPAIARAQDGRLWLAWESFVAGTAPDSPGSIDVVAAPLGTGAGGLELGALARVGDGPYSDLEPALAADGGALAIAWSRHGGREYDVLVRRLDPATGALAAPIDVSLDGSSDDVHPALCAAGDGTLGIAWDRLEDSWRGTSMPGAQHPESEAKTQSVHVMFARLRGDAVEVAAGADGWLDGAVAGASRLSWMGGVPQLAADAKGRLWIAYRYLFQLAQRGGRYGDPVVVQRLDPAGFTRAIEIERSVGFAERPAIAPNGAGVVAAGQCDERLEATSMFNGSDAPETLHKTLVSQGIDVGTWLGPTAIFLAAIGEAEAPLAGSAPETAAQATPITFVARPDRSQEHHPQPAADLLADPIVAGREHLKVSADGKEYQVYWGDLHRHSSVSRCSHGYEPAPTARYEFGRDAHLYDFMAMTDHSGQVDPFSWWQLDKLCWLYRDPRFCPLAGYECTAQVFGHQNVILDGRISPLVAFSANSAHLDRDNAFKYLYQRLTEGHAIAIPHTTADTGRRTRFGDCDPRFVKLVEVYQALRGNYEFNGCRRQSVLANERESFVQAGLDGGLEFGLIASTDHGNGCAYAGVLAERLDVASLFDGLKSRRTFGATVKGLFPLLTLDGALMGEEVQSVAPKLHVKIRAPIGRELSEVVVFRNGQPWRALGRDLEGTDQTTLQIELVAPFENEPPRMDWSTTIKIAGATFTTMGGRTIPSISSGQHGFTADGTTLRFLWPKGLDEMKPKERHVKARTRRDAEVTIQSRNDPIRLTVGDLLAGPFIGKLAGQNWTLIANERFDDGHDIAKGMGVREIDQEWSDDSVPDKPTWYYVRATQTDGEMAWSSPVFVKPPTK